MSTNKLAGLQNALNQSTGRTQLQQSTATVPVVASTPVEAVSVPATPKPAKAASRADQVNISAWLPKGFKTSLRLVQAKKPENSALQDLMAEAFNDLFSKYNVPTVGPE